MKHKNNLIRIVTKGCSKTLYVMKTKMAFLYHQCSSQIGLDLSKNEEKKHENTVTLCLFDDSSSDVYRMYYWKIVKKYPRFVEKDC